VISRRTKLLIVIGVVGLALSIVWWRTWYKATYGTRGEKWSVSDSSIEWTPEVDLHPPMGLKVLLLGSVVAIVVSLRAGVGDLKRQTILRRAQDGAKD